jgi:hypothetical protein
MLQNIKNYLRQIVEALRKQEAVPTPVVAPVAASTSAANHWLVPNGEMFELAGQRFPVFIPRDTKPGHKSAKFMKIGQTFHNLAPRNPRGLSQHGKFVR